jgi:hypothetical protein
MSSNEIEFTTAAQSADHIRSCLAKVGHGPVDEYDLTAEIELRVRTLPVPTLLAHACTQHTMTHSPHTHTLHFHVDSGPLVSDVSGQTSCLRRDHDTQYPAYYFFNPVYTRRVESSTFLFSLSSHRQSYVGLIFSSRFIDSS